MNRRKQLSYRIKKWWRQLTWQDVEHGYKRVMGAVCSLLLFIALVWGVPFVVLLLFGK